MKKSNQALTGLSVLLLVALFITDGLLVRQYATINLNDPYKNFQQLSIQPFTALRIRGGNGYAIRIEQGPQYGIRLMNSRKTFFKMLVSNDTLLIRFTVANQQYQQADKCIVGLIITVPELHYLQLSGTNNEIGPLQLDSLLITQDENTQTRLKELQVRHLKIDGKGMSSFNYLHSNQIGYLDVHLKNTAISNFREINFQQISTDVQDSAAVVFYEESLEMFKRTKQNTQKNP